MRFWNSERPSVFDKNTQKRVATLLSNAEALLKPDSDMPAAKQLQGILSTQAQVNKAKDDLLLSYEGSLAAKIDRYNARRLGTLLAIPFIAAGAVFAAVAVAETALTVFVVSAFFSFFAGDFTKRDLYSAFGRLEDTEKSSVRLADPIAMKLSAVAGDLQKARELFFVDPEKVLEAAISPERALLHRKLCWDEKKVLFDTFNTHALSRTISAEMPAVSVPAALPASPAA